MVQEKRKFILGVFMVDFGCMDGLSCCNFSDSYVAHLKYLSAVLDYLASEGR